MQLGESFLFLLYQKREALARDFSWDTALLIVNTIPNKEEHSWDCPCHGSRFTAQGELIDNPATDDKKSMPHRS